MKIKTFTVSVLLLISLCINAQTQFKVAEKFKSRLSDSITSQIIHSLDKLLISIENEQVDTTLIDNEHADLNYNFFRYLKGNDKKDTIPHYYQAQLINLYPIENHQCMLTISYAKNDEIGCILNFLVKENNGNITFATPLKYNTRYWKTATVGTLTYFFRDTIDIERAKVFDQKNISMAQKLNLPLRTWDVYMCSNFQEILQLQGYLYESTDNGLINSGYIMDPKTLFSVMNDEDFSHDVLHGYARVIRGDIRNAKAECGLAYYWGNAYYFGKTGKSPNLEELIPALQQYLQEHKDAKLLDLFDKSPNVLAEYGYPKPIQVHYIIAGIICKEIEKRKGTEGIIEVLKSGKGDENFFKCMNNLIGINRDNFNTEVKKLVFAK